MHKALYRKWRPQTFDDVCGQEHITSILKYETQNKRFSHAYLFCGSRGTGKTTCAKILAKAINCENPINGNPCNCCPSCISIDNGTATDVLEMDAASNNGVDNIREIRDEVVYMPSSLKYRVYIVDEVHMLSGSAFNALLKTLEEPPSHVVFVLATTELHKLLPTIISRCQRFDFRRISTSVLMDRLAYISDNEGIKYENDALRIIAKAAQGGMRDAISLLELCAGTQNDINLQTVNETLGSSGRENIVKLVNAIAKGNFDAIFATINDVTSSSKDISVFFQELLAYYRDMLVMKTTVSADKYLDLTESERDQLKRSSDLFTKSTLLWHCRVLDETTSIMQKAVNSKRVIAEMALVKMSDTMLDTSLDAILSRISKLENAVAMGTNFISANNTVENTEQNSEEVSKTAENPINDLNETTIANLDISPVKPFRGWVEVAEKAAAGDNIILPFLKMARAYYDENGKFYIRFPHEFAKKQVEKSGVSNDILAALCITLSKNISPNNIVFEIFTGDEENTELDDLNI